MESLIKNQLLDSLTRSKNEQKLCEEYRRTSGVQRQTNNLASTVK